MTPQREKEILEIDVRRNIYEIVKKFAGCHFREIERKSGFSTGSVKYHLDYLIRNGLITQEKDNGNVRYYPIEFMPENKRLLGLLRQESIRKILLFLLTHGDANHEQIASFTGLSPSTVSWHLKKLEQNGIVRPKRSGRKSTYLILIDKKDIISLLITYKESFLDSLVDNVIEMWDLD
ncbi:MAG: winged helix-turn-helix transcriptional regulator [Candidatus Woesearchaeota archaeon]|nr:winged helix-turn-helix transcriptional regulator [Candidatus Woesearchaeota archaeon]